MKPKLPSLRQGSSSQSFFWLALTLTIVVGMSLAGILLWVVGKDKSGSSKSHPDPVALAEGSAPQKATPDFSKPVARNQVVDSPHTAPVQPAASAEAPACNLRITAMTRFGTNNVIVGVEHRLTRKTQMMRVGDQAGDGWTLASVDFNRESATFSQQEFRHTAYLEKGAALPQEARLGVNASVPGAQSSEEVEPVTVARPPYQGVFSNQVLTVEGDREVAVSGVEHAPEYVEVKTAGSNFALRRDIAENILKLESITPEQKLQMLLTYPGATPVDSGQDPAQQAAAAEASLAQTLSQPPETTPSVEELDRLVKELPEIEPPPEQPPKAP